MSTPLTIETLVRALQKAQSPGSTYMLNINVLIKALEEEETVEYKKLECVVCHATTKIVCNGIVKFDTPCDCLKSRQRTYEDGIRAAIERIKEENDFGTYDAVIKWLKSLLPKE